MLVKPQICLQGEHPMENAIFQNTLPISCENQLLVHNYNLIPHDTLHYHRSIELGICMKGSGSSETNGISQTFQTQDVSIIFPFQEHKNLSNPSEDCVWNYIFIDMAELASITGNNLSVFTELIPQIKVYGILNPSIFPDAHERITQIIHAVEKKERYCFPRIYALLLLLFLDLIRQSKGLSTPPVQLPEDFETLMSILTTVYDLLQNEVQISAEELARTCSVSPSTLRRLFRNTLNTSPKKYISSCAIQFAKTYLATTNLSITEIAHKTGFREISTFNREFSAHTGIAPRQYRNEFRQGAIL